ncbi:MAG: hypothetical protein ACRDK3_02275 [Actinomycetota bacterium]
MLEDLGARVYAFIQPLLEFLQSDVQNRETVVYLDQPAIHGIEPIVARLLESL